MISLKLLREFWLRHPDAERPLRLWYKPAVHARWTNLQQLRADLPHADGITSRRGETLTVFNISGNKYRLVARVRYDFQLINVRAVLMHAEYDRERWKES